MHKLFRKLGNPHQLNNSRQINIRKLKLQAVHQTELKKLAIGGSTVEYGIRHPDWFNLGLSNPRLKETAGLIYVFGSKFERIALFLEWIMFVDNQDVLWSETNRILDRVLDGFIDEDISFSCLRYPLQDLSWDERIASCKVWFKLSKVYKGRKFDPTTFETLLWVVNFCDEQEIKLDLILSPVHVIHLMWLTDYFGSGFLEWKTKITPYTGQWLQPKLEAHQEGWLDPCHWTPIIGDQLLERLGE